MTPTIRKTSRRLEAVQPADLTASDIDARLGAVGFRAADVEGFARSLLGAEGITVSHAAVVGTWFLRGDYGARATVANSTEWGTNRYSALELIQDALNLKTPTVYDTDPRTKNSVVNATGDGSCTRQTGEDQGALQNVGLGGRRAARTALPQVQRRVQLRAAARLQRQPSDAASEAAISSLCVRTKRTPSGASSRATTRCSRTRSAPGKTYTMVAAAIELKRLGLATKPMFAVPNHMLAQFSSELLTLYPTANILVAGKEDFEASQRARLFSRIATGNWDAVIVTHSSFEKIPLSVETRRDFIDEQIREIEMAIREQSARQRHAARKGIGTSEAALGSEAGDALGQ